MPYVVTETYGKIVLEVVLDVGVGVGVGSNVDVVGVGAGVGSDVDVMVTVGRAALDIIELDELENKRAENELGCECKETETKVICDVGILVDEAKGNNVVVVEEGIVVEEKVFDTDEVGDDVCDGFCDDVGSGGGVDNDGDDEWDG